MPSQGALWRQLFALGMAYPVMRLWLGLRVRHRARLPQQGPAIIVANHNSHLDILALLALFPLRRVPDVQTVAATDYFCKSRWLRWFSTHLVGIIPIVRGSGQAADIDPLEGCYRALAAGQVVIVFPEGTRGQPEQFGELKSGIWYLARRFPQVPIVPVFLAGMGKSMPRGAPIAVPMNVQAIVGHPLSYLGDKAQFMSTLREQLCELRAQLGLAESGQERPAERSEASRSQQ
ncbi:lysophospholipid acyltransferase family protein [Hymenobacter sp. H14-R3]|uniref:lysophospholipid acyltransferase family protein n=1 Tax=Hymenobacter sp. H14-R3 TaxID=3046308 RepID=UPI0024BA5664|nr:lysophospholipid acyltransferase family protein [Hymenobacter sp. H14-R3]MDJ0366109.1 lysophospholipid acyltransferase family protein [Hymenobacter sp. H14-R3]